MNILEFKLLSKPRMAALVLVTGSAFGLLAACSNDSNSVPTPVVNTGGGGSGGGSVAGGAGDNSAGDNSAGESNASGGSAQGGGANGGAAGAAGEAGAGGEGGEAGSTGATPATCPTSDLGFYNQPSTSQTAKFDNVQRLGTYTTLPTLPGG
jgi:hypothetical protein